jgi:hypothetical protein
MSLTWRRWLRKFESERNLTCHFWELNGSFSILSHKEPLSDVARAPKYHPQVHPSTHLHHPKS